MSEPPIDSLDLNERTLGNRKLKAELLTLFKEQASDLWSDLQRAIRIGQPTIAAKSAHRLAGAAATISAKGLSRQIHAIEEALQAGDVEWARAALPAASDMLAASLRQIERLSEQSK